MYELDPKGCYTMPTYGGFRTPRPWEAGGMRYGHVSSLSVRFRTDRALVERCVPHPFRVDDNPIVGVTFQKCQDIDWLGGRGYNLVGVDVGATFDGQVDRGVRGAYCIVMWENLCEPIIGGREHSGVPKVFADIDSPHASACRVSRFGHTFLTMSASNLKPQSKDTCRKLERDKREANWMCYKHIPRLENDGADTSYATVYPTSGQCVSASVGKGSIDIRPATFKQVPTQHEVINLLAALPVIEVEAAMLTQWKEVRLLDRLPRRLA